MSSRSQTERRLVIRCCLHLLSYPVTNVHLCMLVSGYCKIVRLGLSRTSQTPFGRQDGLRPGAPSGPGRGVPLGGTHGTAVLAVGPRWGARSFSGLRGGAPSGGPSQLMAREGGP